jgi:hypothetical protein
VLVIALAWEPFLDKPEVTPMSDNKSGALTVELITRCINELAQEVGVMEPDNPRWATVLEELFQLTQLRRAVKFASTPVGSRPV